MPRSLGCNDLTGGKKFTLLLGVDANIPSYSVPNSGLPVPVKIKSDGGFVILINQLPIFDFGQDVISSSHFIKNVMSSVNKLDAVNKAYVDRIKYKSSTDNIPNTVMTDHTLITFPAA